MNSLLSPTDKQEDVIHYVQMLETQYNEKIQRLQKNLEKAQKLTMTERTKNVGRMCERADMEVLFSESIEEVRRKIVHRRLTAELN
jgi:hypothetical protein